VSGLVGVATEIQTRDVRYEAKAPSSTPKHSFVCLFVRMYVNGE